MFARPIGIAALAIIAFAPGCSRQDQPAATRPSGAVVVYTALDRQFSEPILADFTQRTGIPVDAVYDTESTKTVGLVNRIREESARPRCDVFWNNEILHTLRLKSAGLLQPSQPANAADYPPQYKDPEGYWFGFAARARVLIVNTTRVAPDQMPPSVLSLADPRWRGQSGIAKPLFGTTASHVACLFAAQGPTPARALLASYQANEVQVLAGNKACAEMVGAGRLAFALTDTDDAIVEREAGRPVAIVFPDTGPREMGTLLLPNTLALIKNCPHPAEGAQLIDYLLSAEVEARLVQGPSAQIPLNKKAPAQSRALGAESLKPMRVDFVKAAAAFDEAVKYAEQILLAP